jgi:hypoxanthine phosphoribosyltransferase
MAKLRKLRPRRMRTCVLLDKPSRRIERVSANYVGFEIPNYFVVGYGLDYAERYRNLPFVGVLHPEMYKNPDFIPLLSAKKRLLLQGVKTL